MSRTFPANFVWGAAAASYQIEGGAYADDKGLSTWDMYCKKPGMVWNGQSGEVACDHEGTFGRIEGGRHVLTLR